MTDRIHALTVILEKDMRDDDVQSLVDAILHMKNVISIRKHITAVESIVSEDRIQRLSLWLQEIAPNKSGSDPQTPIVPEEGISHNTISPDGGSAIPQGGWKADIPKYGGWWPL